MPVWKRLSLILWLSGTAALGGCSLLEWVKPAPPCPLPEVPVLPYASPTGVWLTPRDMQMLLIYFEQVERCRNF